ncbi:hypothetical protein ACFLZA_01735, partial [Candidatus Neomarinimicrobiota bacterium]
MKQELFDLNGKNIAITGGAGVLGAALAKGLSEAGTRVSGRNAFIDDIFNIQPTLFLAICRPNICDGIMVPVRFKPVTNSRLSLG